ncbi:uncharacterized protein LOC142324713 isoform X2 [Lycorma delicatula]
MRIKKVALIGAFLLTVGCIILYLILDETLPHDVRQVSKLHHEQENIEQGQVRHFQAANESIKKVVHPIFKPVVVSIPYDAKCNSFLQTPPRVDIQMSAVYD